MRYLVYFPDSLVESESLSSGVGTSSHSGSAGGSSTTPTESHPPSLILPGMHVVCLENFSNPNQPNVLHMTQGDIIEGRLHLFFFWKIAPSSLHFLATQWSNLDFRWRFLNTFLIQICFWKDHCVHCSWKTRLFPGAKLNALIKSYGQVCKSFKAKSVCKVIKKLICLLLP